MTKFKNKNLSASSKSWLRRSKNNIYSHGAAKTNLPSRSYFKLEEIQNKYQLFQKHHRVLDLGCSPGGWSCFLQKYTAHIHGCDLLNSMETPIEKFILGSFLDEDIQKEFTLYHSIVSDMAVNATGNKWTDQYQNQMLAEAVWSFIPHHLLVNGHFIIKLFESAYTHDFVKNISNYFHRVEKFKPKSSYKDSSEIYLVAIKFKSPKIHT